MRTNKIKIAVIGLLCCMAIGMSVMAFDQSYPYAIGPKETKTITSFVPGTSTIYLNTRPVAGGDVTISLSGAVTDSNIFPYYTSRADWKVTGVNASSTLTIKGKAGSKGASGSLHVWSK